MRGEGHLRPQRRYGEYGSFSGSSSSDGLSHSSSSGGSSGQSGLARPIIRPSLDQANLVHAPERPRAILARTNSPISPGMSTQEPYIFDLNGQQINETYNPRLSVATGLKESIGPQAPAYISGRSHLGVDIQRTSKRPSTRNAQSHWISKQESKVKILQLSKRYWTKDVYHTMSQFGIVVRIEMEIGSRDNNVWVTFHPLNTTLPDRLCVGGDFVRYEIRQPFNTVLSPVNSDVRYKEISTLFPSSLTFSVQTGERTLVRMQEVIASDSCSVQLNLDLNRKELKVRFPLNIDEQEHNFYLQLPISQLSHIYISKDDIGDLSLVIPFNRSPQFFAQKRPKMEDYHLFPANERVWNIWSTMFRETDIVDCQQRARMQTTPLMNSMCSAIIDIGRWTTYHLSFTNETLSGQKFDEFRKALCDFGVTVQESEQFAVTLEEPPALTDMLEEEYVCSQHHLKPGPKRLSIASDLASNRIHLSFPIRYQLEVCLSNGLIKEATLTHSFLEKLKSLHPNQAIQILEKVAEKQHIYYDPMAIFNVPFKILGQRSIPKHCVMQRSVNITPTMMHVASPAMEISNRITRQNFADSDRFIRVKFSDEKGEGALRNIPGGRADALFDRVRRAMDNGIVIAGRYYQLLAYGNSQFREHGAYFYAPTSTKSAEDIRLTLGRFNHIGTVAKYGARLGQCFSTTRAIQITVAVKQIPDIERNGYTFTDGVGKLSLFLAQMAAQDLGLQCAFNDPPSLFQFRLGGCKGVLALDRAITKNEVHIRPSQIKFEAPFSGLEIIRYSSLATPFFNRQIIVILSDLGLPDHIFIRKQQQMVNAYELAMTDKNEALNCLLKHVDMNQTTLVIASMVSDGFLDSKEPFVISLLNLWRASTIKDLKKKARIAIDEGAFVLGCIDESGTLKGHRDDPQSRVNATREGKMESLPEVFIQIEDTRRDGYYKVIEGVCVLARNPSLHPGDIRIVRAVDVPALRHHKNVVVLPQNGDRDLANMCSGGDLDGDDYMVLWDQDLIPKTVNVPPMDFTPEKPIEKTGPINISEVSEFFVTYMKNDSLGQIAHAHLAQADQQLGGVFSETCMTLAKLHSQAVDYSKSGIPAIMENFLRPKKWPHFMEKKYKAPGKIYQSKNILGMLYDQVQLVDFKPSWDDNFDQRILSSFEPDDLLLKKAAEVKANYDGDLKRLMARYGIKTEFEAFSVFVLDHNDGSRDYKFAEEFGRTVGMLKAQHREACLAASDASSVIDWDRFGPFVAAMYSVTAHEVRSALEECNRTKLVGGQTVSARNMEVESMPFMSFPWLFHTQLGRLATGGNPRPGIGMVQAHRPHKERADYFEDDEELSTVQTEEGIALRLSADETRNEGRAATF